MRIQDMFYDDINREINGVIKVDQSAESTIEQELSEYVITRELKKHFVTLFEDYSNSFDRPNADVGVWISGFFGSGKSHFLKILSYLFENKEVNGIKTVDRFEEKFEDDPHTYELIKKSTQGTTDTILFNIDIEGPMKKDKTAVLRVFAKMFYNHLGFYGENLKVAKLEQYIDKKGKTDEFRRVFEEKDGNPWIESRDVFEFSEDEIVATLIEVLEMSESSARNWFDSSEDIELSIASLVSEIKDYVNTQPEDYRLLFMIDEVGQYIGSDTNLLLNLQSLIEKLGSECMGKVWVMATGQEALDEIIKMRSDEFSRIQARFKTRLSLSSSSADEVIQKRILKKNEESKMYLETIYDEEKNVMDNLFKFKEAVGDIRGFESSEEYSINFPFVPYQYILMQKVFTEIRKHGNAGKHLSGGERSMLSGFQEAAQRIQDKNEYSIIPFWMFYDTVHTFLDSSIRRVIERAERAANDGKGLEQFDVKVLKLLYMIRYVDDIPANLDNIVIMMAEDIRVDKICEREKIQDSLDRLTHQNYIARTADTYNFLTDEEQDVEREIRSESIDPTEVSRKIADMIFGEVYTTKKYRYRNRYDFDFNKKVDGINFGNPVDGMEIEILTTATSLVDKNELALTHNTYRKVVVVLEETEYYNYIENAMKITKFSRKKNIPQLPQSMQNIIRSKQDDAEQFNKDALNELKDAFKNATFFIDSERVTIKQGTPKEKMDVAFEHLVSTVYNKLDYIEAYTHSDEEIYDLLNGTGDGILSFESNRKAVNEVETYLNAQNQQNLPTNMADIQSRFTVIPYGWLEMDVAAIVARLISEQKASVKYGGETIRPDDTRLPAFLHKRSEIGKTKIQKREMISSQKIEEARGFLRDFFDKMDVPRDDDSLVAFIIDEFEALKDHYDELLNKYQGKNYPDRQKVIDAKGTVAKLLSAQSDNIALVNKLIEMEYKLEDTQEDLEAIEEFFNSQVDVFDEAVKMENELSKDHEYLKNESEANDALNKIRLIVSINPRNNNDNYDYSEVPRLNEYMKIVEDGHKTLLSEKRNQIFEIIRQCLAEIHQADDRIDREIKEIITKSDHYYTQKKKEISDTKSLIVLDGIITSLWNEKDKAVLKITAIMIYKKEREKRRQEEAERRLNSKVQDNDKGTDEAEIDVIRNSDEPIKPQKHIKSVYRQAVFPPRILENENDIKAYVKAIEQNLLNSLGDYDGIEIS